MNPEVIARGIQRFRDSYMPALKGRHGTLRHGVGKFDLIRTSDCSAPRCLSVANPSKRIVRHTSPRDAAALIEPASHGHWTRAIRVKESIHPSERYINPKTISVNG